MCRDFADCLHREAKAQTKHKKREMIEKTTEYAQNYPAQFCYPKLNVFSLSFVRYSDAELGNSYGFISQIWLTMLLIIVIEILPALNSKR